MIEKVPSDPAVAVPTTAVPINSSTVLPASASPVIVGLLIVKVVSDGASMVGCSGAVVSIVNANAVEADEVFPASSVAVTVRL